MLGVSTGGRISELLNLQIGDVFQNGTAVIDLLYDRLIVNGGEVSRVVPVNVDGREAIKALIDWHRENYGTIASKRPLFPSRNKKGSIAMNRKTAHEMLKQAFTAAVEAMALRTERDRTHQTSPSTIRNGENVAFARLFTLLVKWPFR